MSKIERTIRNKLQSSAIPLDIETLTAHCKSARAATSRATVKKYIAQMPDVEAIPGRPVRYHLVTVQPDPAPKNPPPDPAQPDKTVFEPGQSDCLDHVLDTIRALADENMMLKRQLQIVREALV